MASVCTIGCSWFWFLGNMLIPGLLGLLGKLGSGGGCSWGGGPMSPRPHQMLNEMLDSPANSPHLGLSSGEMTRETNLLRSNVRSSIPMC